MMTEKAETMKNNTPPRILPLGFSSHALTFKSSVGPSLRAFFLTLPLILFWALITDHIEFSLLLTVFIPFTWLLVSVKKAGFSSYLLLSISVGLYFAIDFQTTLRPHTITSEEIMLEIYKTTFALIAQWFLFIHLFNQEARYKYKMNKEISKPAKNGRKAIQVIGLLSLLLIALYGLCLYIILPSVAQYILICDFAVEGTFLTSCGQIYPLWLIYCLTILVIVMSGLAIFYALLRTPIRRHILYGAIWMICFSIGVYGGTAFLQTALLRNDTFVRIFCPETAEEAGRQDLIGCHPDSKRR